MHVSLDYPICFESLFEGKGNIRVTIELDW